MKTNSIRPLRFSNSIFLILLFLTQAVSAEQLVLKYNVAGSGNYYPYYIDDKSNPGILPEIIKQVMQLADIQVQHIELPAKRTIKYLHQGHIDFDVISPEWLSQAEKQNPQFSYSDTLFTVDEYLVSLTNSVARWQQLDSIRNQPVGTVLGYYYYDDNRFKRVDFHSEQQLIQALKMQRVEVVIIDKLPALYWAKLFDADISFGALHSLGNLKIRLRSEHQSLLPKINAAIKKLKSSGSLDTIINKYTKSIPLQ
ncbi:transporter substrate-binding domain-containing protein [Pseudoalteromonas sp. BZP1]|uniref:substrate-binding periplasmic protein n=1 Tax=unclassified Pseudoalteromonas TaxID=194690 RepID=UPI0032C46477